MTKTVQALTTAALTTLIGLATVFLAAPAGAAKLPHPGHDDRDMPTRVADATYQLYIRISPPGRSATRSVAFCTASFYLHDTTATEEPDYDWQDPVGREPGYYGTTAGHCLDAYGVIRDRFKQRWWGLEFELAVARGDKGDQTFVSVDAVDHGFKRWRDWLEADRDEQEHMTRPSPGDVDDWGIIRASDDADLHTIPVAEPESVSRGDTVYTTGYPFGLGKMWSAGVAQPDYRMPGILFDHYVVADYVSRGGQSGSPVVNARGELVGINVATFTGGGPAVATPVGRVEFPEEDVDDDSGALAGPNRRGFMYNDLLRRDDLDFPAPLDRVESEIRNFVEQHAPEQ